MASFFGKDHRQNLSLAIGETTHPFVGELFAIHLALHIYYVSGGYKGNQVILRTDCLNVIKALYDFKANNERGFEGKLVKYVLTEQDKKNLKNLYHLLKFFPKRVIMQWVESHVGDPANDEADKLASRKALLGIHPAIKLNLV
ncbi:unnamed protein product, partial [Mesorhabditis belari]|uniref:RNase H type-1 domain-containing protein n=1 Tax=Mesorhabditis belari TaxID=2138241 RepID=A0AAF3F5N5_9BILA